MEAYDDEESTAAKILVSLRTKTLLHSPEWIPRPEEEEEGCDAVGEALRWGKGRPATRRGRANPEVWRKMVRELELGVVHCGGGAGVGSGASSSGEDAARSEPRAARKVKVKAEHMAAAAVAARRPVEFGAGAGSAGYFGAKDAAPSPPLPHRSREKTKVKVKVKVEFSAAREREAPRYYAVAAAVGSVPSTSDVDRARSRSRPRSIDKAAVAVPRKEDMDASSPETPLDYAAAVGSGASSSGEEAAAGSPAKRKAPGAVGSGGASSGDEGCSTPPKRPHLAGGEDKVEEAKIADNSSTDYRDKNGVLLFDLNEGLNQWEE